MIPWAPKRAAHISGQVSPVSFIIKNLKCYGPWVYFWSILMEADQLFCLLERGKMVPAGLVGGCHWLF